MERWSAVRISHLEKGVLYAETSLIHDTVSYNDGRQDFVGTRN